MSITLPIHISFKDWASQIRIDLPDVSIPIPPDVQNWKSWAAQVVTSNNLTNIPLPTENSYLKDDDWRVWAAYFISSVY